jgi:hypothetical protein
MFAPSMAAAKAQPGSRRCRRGGLLVPPAGEARPVGCKVRTLGRGVGISCALRSLCNTVVRTFLGQVDFGGYDFDNVSFIRQARPSAYQ